MDAAFANIQMWGATANMVAFGYSSLLCNYTKIYIVMALWLLGLVGYLAAEFLVNKQHGHNLKVEMSEDSDS